MRTRIFFSVNNKDYLLVTNYRIIEFQSHGVSRTVTDFFLLSFLVPNYRIFEFQSHGISRTVTDFLFFFSCPEFSRLVLGPTDRREVIIEFLSSVILRDSPCD